MTKKMIKEKKEAFSYQMLDRLRLDCEYYLNNGHRDKKCLWAGNEIDHIQEMKNIYNSLSNNKKPEWLTWSQILEYENKLIN